MINTSAAYKAAITADARRIYLKATVSIIDPDIVMTTPAYTGTAPWAKVDQVSDKEHTLADAYATLERGRWRLDGNFRSVPDDPKALPGQIGMVSGQLSGDSGEFDPPVYFEQRFSGVDILQACSVFFPTEEYDGVPEDFTVEIRQGGTAYHTETFTGNSSTSVSVTGFTVYDPDAIRVTVTKWSLPGRRMRIAEITPGVYEEWGGDMLAEFSIAQQANVANTSIPYGTCHLRLDNLDRRFEPLNKSGMFKSLEERQPISTFIGVQLGDGTVQYMPSGVFYQYETGWKTGSNDILMEWTLVDIIGLFANREYIPPATLPTTLGGWVASIVAQLGEIFEDKYEVDPDYAGAPVTANSRDDVTGQTCGTILRYVCMASGTFPRADAETGKLAVEPMWRQGNELTLDNMTSYPSKRANPDVAAVIFTLADGHDTQYVVSGTAVAASRTESVSNPFIHTAAQAMVAARNILSVAGGNQIEITGRGDPSSEIGDIPTVQLDESNATVGRMIYQTFEFHDGVLRDCKATLIQPDGGEMFEESVLLIEDGTWVAPQGATRLYLAIGGGGQGGMYGEAGTSRGDGAERRRGEAGTGGLIWFGTVDINPQQSFAVHIGAGGASSSAFGEPGQLGGATTFGAYSSANGAVFSPSFTDIVTGGSFGRTGVHAPASGTSDGGAGGDGGRNSLEKENEDGSISTVRRKTAGKPGVAGASGFVLIRYSREEAGA